jgi:hypothetical protein
MIGESKRVIQAIPAISSSHPISTAPKSQQRMNFARPPKLTFKSAGKAKKALMNTLIAIAKPGQMCDQGQACSGGSICKEGVCACSDDEMIIDNKCVNSEGEALQVRGRKMRNFHEKVAFSFKKQASWV